MRLPFLALAAVSLVPFQVGCDFEGIADASDHYREDFQYSYNLKPGGRLSVESFNGAVEILGWEKDSVQITGTKYASRPDLLKELKVETRADDNSVVIRTVRPSGWHGGAGAKYSIRVPFKVQLDRISTSNGAIRVEDVQGTVRLETSNGGIRLRKVEGRVEGRTSNGGIESDGLTGDATLHTSNGGIRLDGVAGALDAELLQSGGGFNGGGVAGATGAIEDDIAVAGNLMAALGEGLGCDVERAGQGEGFVFQIVGVAQINDENIFACVEPALQFDWLQTGGNQFVQNHAAANDTCDEEAGDAQKKQGPGEASHTIEQAGILHQQRTEEAAGGQQQTDPERGPDAVEEQKAAEGHAFLPGDGRSEH